MRASFTMITLGSAAALLAACGGGGGGTGGNGGNGGGGTTTTSTTTTTDTTSTTSSTTTDTTSTTSSSTTTTTAGPGCVELCTELTMCPSVPNTDCNADCPPVETFNTTSGCDDEYAAEVACILAASDPCAAGNSDCTAEVGAYVTCSDDYCAAHPATPGCT